MHNIGLDAAALDKRHLYIMYIVAYIFHDRIYHCLRILYMYTGLDQSYAQLCS